MKLQSVLPFAMLATTTSLISSCKNANSISLVVSTPAVQYLYVVCDQCTGTNTPSEVVTYAVNSSSTAPVTTLTSPAGQHWQAVATDSSGNIYVVSATGSATSNYVYSILVYAAGSIGTATPARTITSSSITQAGFVGMIVAPSGTVYYADFNYGLEVYSPTASGVSMPTFINPNYHPQSGGVDAAGNIFFRDTNSLYWIDVLPSNFTSTSTATSITSAVYSTAEFIAVSLDSSGNIYASFTNIPGAPTRQLFELPHTTTSGPVTPIKLITLPTLAPTSFAAYSAPAVDSLGNIYLYTNLGPITVAEIAASATSGTPMPINTITTTLTTIDPSGLVVH